MNLVRRSVGAGRKSNSQSFSQASEAVLFQCEEGERWGTFAVFWARAGYNGMWWFGSLWVCRLAFKMYKVCLDTSSAELHRVYPFSFVCQVSQVYQTIEFKRFASLVPFADKFRLERIIVGAAKNMELQVRHGPASFFGVFWKKLMEFKKNF